MQHSLDGQLRFGLAAFKYIAGMQECRPLQAYFHKGRLHAGQYSAHHTTVDVANQAQRGTAFNLQFLHHAILHHGNARLLWRYIN